MIRVEVKGQEEIQRLLGSATPKQVKAGTKLGIQRATNALADYVSAHVPRKTGKAARGIRARMKGQLTGVVDYDPKTAWYLRIVDGGAKPHSIAPKGTRRRAKRAAAATKRPRVSFGARVRRALKKLRRVVHRVILGKSGRRTPTKRVTQPKKKALAFTVKGTKIVRRAVNHPGIKARNILANSLAASESRITQTINDAVISAVESGASTHE